MAPSVKKVQDSDDDDEEDSDDEESSSSGDSADESPAPAVKAAAPVAADAKANEVKAAAVGLADGKKPEETGKPTTVKASPTAPATASSFEQLMILEAEPVEDLFIVSDAADCGAWIEQAIERSQFVAIVRTPAASATSVIVEAPLAEKCGISAEVRQHPWVGLRVKRRLGDAHVPLSVLDGLCQQLVEMGVEPRTLVPFDSRCYLLISRSGLQEATAALVRAGHLVSPMARVCALAEPPVTDTEQLRPHVGAWRLVRRERGPSGSAAVEEFDTSAADPVSSGAPVRIQALNGLFVDFRAPSASCLGTLSLEGGNASKAIRHVTVSFQPPVGAPPPQGRIALVGASLHEELPAADEKGVQPLSVGPAGGSLGERVLEQWVRLDGGNEKVTVLELAEGEANGSSSKSKRGAWLFCGKYFVRLIGPVRGEGVVAGACCQSLAQLEVLRGAEPVQSDLRKHYEAMFGQIEQPGLLRVSHDAWDAARAGTIFYDAKVAAAENSKSSCGSIDIQLEAGTVLHKLPTGEVQKWHIRDWAFDPFTPPPAPKPAAKLASESGSSDDEEEEEEEEEEGDEEEEDWQPLVDPEEEPDYMPAETDPYLADS
mmetsp:Transcript_140671/g.269837  ORF Transcript_140671/g.269837 Transcript_140671/m.269837 type:complete len:600 (+) Transcript_140671:156-1955(+)